MSATAPRTLDRHIVATPGTCGGRPRIAGRRITVEDIAVWHVHMGMSEEEIAAEYDLDLADIHAALTYYFDHRDDIECRMREEEAFVESIKHLPQEEMKREIRAFYGDKDPVVRGRKHPPGRGAGASQQPR